jgi:hypothetical protein
MFCLILVARFLMRRMAPIAVPRHPPIVFDFGGSGFDEVDGSDFDDVQKNAVTRHPRIVFDLGGSDVQPNAVTRHPPIVGFVVEVGFFRFYRHNVCLYVQSRAKCYGASWEHRI